MSQPDLGQLLQALSGYLGSGSAQGQGGSAGFDPNAYLQANPDVAQAGADPFLHFLQYGYNEGRSPTGGAPVGSPLPISATPTLNPSDPNSWAGWRTKAHAQTDGLNVMPNVMSDTSSLLGRGANDIYAQFYGQSPIAKARNLGMGA